MKLLDGKALADEIFDEITVAVETINGRPPGLAVVIVGENPASQVYVKRKAKASKQVGIYSEIHELPPSTSEEQLLELVDQLNSDEHIDGILVQLPLPKHIDSVKVTQRISAEKDVDGFHPTNLGKLLLNDTTGFIPCTPLGVYEMLQRTGIEVEGKHVVILGRSHIVGKPLANLMTNANATVTLLHSRSQNVEEYCRSADILVAAVGVPQMVKPDMVREGCVMIDVGINRVDADTPKGYKLVGDVDFEAVKDGCAAITPVPGGVGPMTIAMLLSNTLKSYKQRCVGSSFV